MHGQLFAQITFEQIAIAGSWLWFATWAFALAWIDIRERRLPNRMVASALVGCMVITGVQAMVLADGGLILAPTMTALVAIVAFAVLHVVGGLGMGDVKYAAVTGWMLGTLGWSAVWWGHVLGFVAGSVVVALGVLAGRVRRGSTLPFGPFMGAGALVVGALVLAG